MKRVLMQISITLVTLALLLSASAAGAGGAPLAPAANWPTDPTADIKWTPDGEYDDVSDVQAAFNYARTQENSQLGLSLPAITFPSQAQWDALSMGQKALWIINQERVARGIAPLSDVESNVTGVAQNYANYLMSTNQWGHYADGHDPDWRLNQNATIAACHDFIPYGENLFALMTSGSTIELPLERAVYGWLYDDSTVSPPWIHRHAAFYYPYTDNSGDSGEEGLMGIGFASGGPYQGYSLGNVIVMNFFDPCSAWVYPATYSVSGHVAASGGSAIAGVTIAANTGASAVTDSNGDYTFSGLSAGTYTLTPSKSGYTFSPGSRQATITFSSVTNVDFTGSPVSATAHAALLPAILYGVTTSSGPTPGYYENPSTQAQWLYVTPGGATVVDFTVFISVSGCGTYSVRHGTAEALSGGQFAFTGSFYASGTFDSPTHVSGVYGFDNFDLTGCGTITSNGDRAWEASWVNSSQP